MKSSPSVQTSEESPLFLEWEIKVAQNLVSILESKLYDSCSLKLTNILCEEKDAGVSRKCNSMRVWQLCYPSFMHEDPM